MQFLRYVPTRYLDQSLAGYVRLGRLRYYRLLERFTGDQWIGDWNEGVAINQVSNLSVDSDPAHDVARARLRTVGIGGNAPVQIINGTFSFEVDGYVLCLSMGQRDTLDGTMTNAEYDSCYSISNLDLFAQAMIETGILSDGRPLKDVCTSVQWQNVVYQSNENDLTANDAISASPFRKHPRFQAQQELRYFFDVRRPISSDHLSFKFDPPSGLIVEEFRNRPGPTVSSLQQRNLSLRRAKHGFTLLQRWSAQQEAIIAKYADPLALERHITRRAKTFLACYRTLRSASQVGPTEQMDRLALRPRFDRNWLNTLRTQLPEYVALFGREQSCS